MKAPSSKIRAVAMDVDGVLTDGSIYLSADGPAQKRLSFRDVMGVSLGRKAGLQFALISGEGGPLLDRISSLMGIEHVYPNCKDKASALQDFASRRNIPLSEICFIGDDINDLSAMVMAGLSVCPSDAHPSVLEIASCVTLQAGGRGAVRELVDRLLQGV
jgi:3-deoxy-D-manno-octulosonate 8-phosphate phosphatase (KDO 8-P phosphatase)